MGKCLVGASLIYDPDTGARAGSTRSSRPVERGERVSVAAVGPDFRLHRTPVSAALRSGIQPVFRLKTRLGRELVRRGSTRC
jgi:hypothetical protein